MAENSVIISSEEEAKLLKPIDEYVEEIQEKNRCITCRRL